MLHVLPTLRFSVLTSTRCPSRDMETQQRQEQAEQVAEEQQQDQPDATPPRQKK
jgi:hypothetical protein